MTWTRPDTEVLTLFPLGEKLLMVQDKSKNSGDDDKPVEKKHMVYTMWVFPKIMVPQNG